MEDQATVEQAEPQGSAAPGQDTSTATSGQEPASSPSFGTLYRQHVEQRADRQAHRVAASSAGRETSAADEQPAPSEAPASRPGSGAPTADGTASPGADASGSQPRLTRAERKAQYTGQTEAGSPSETVSTATTPSDDSGPPDPVVARVAEAVKPIAEGLSRIEGLITPQPSTQDTAAADSEAATAYAKLFGDDAEFTRRAQIALHGSTTGQYLDPSESDELAVWAARREARDFVASQTGPQYQANFNGLVLAAAEAFGVPAEVIQKPGTTFRDIFGAFVTHGGTQKDAELTAERTAHAQTKAAMQQIADENETLRKRLPSSARAVLGGGVSTGSRAAAEADRTRMSGRQLMEAGLRRQMQGRPHRPGAR